ncbi:MAG: FtsW/RodA/SpoVE family cell cycle protein, partial [Acidimicrobiia bacterium]|nr:FtsW/RodA/SpoVE family cell cycle protein [Acidimicrobiia bacterium]
FILAFRLAAYTSAAFNRLVIIGLTTFIASQVFINIGMTIGIAPVTGLPLPFFSMGGSFYLAMALAVGICNSIWLRRTPVPGERYRL